MLNDRQKDILKLIVLQYVKTARPVGSKSICQKLKCSSATIRSDMARLEELGFLEKTHISSDSSILLSNNGKPCFLPWFLGKEKTPH